MQSTLGGLVRACCLSALLLVGCPLVPPDDAEPVPVVLGFPGPLEDAVYLANVDDEFNVSVYYPVSEPPVTHAPLVVFNVGWNAVRNTYTSYCRQLAQWGYVCVIRYYPSTSILGIGPDLFSVHVAQTLRVIDWAEEQNQDPLSPIYGMVDTTNVGLVGHSLGGSVSLVTAPMNPAVHAVVSLDARFDHEGPGRDFDFENTDAYILYLGASVESICSQTPDTDMDLYAATERPKELVMIQGADHLDFMEDPPQSPDSQDAGQPICSVGTAAAKDVRIIAHRYMISWFNAYLKGETEFESYFRGDSALEDVAAGLVTIDDQI